MNKVLNQNLTHFNTFGLNCIAAEYAVINSETDLAGFSDQDDIFILGGGSNLLLPSRLEKLVLHNNINFIHVDHTKSNEAFVTVGAGVNWHQLVSTCVSLNLGGIENLALIPGNVGAAPVQNIGAYGVELKDVFVELRAYDLHQQKMVVKSITDCNFEYRNSIFKNKAKGRYIITAVTFRLISEGHQPNATYYAIQEEADKRGISSPSIRDIYDMVVAIRGRKLPDPATLGNSGSFFKNPVIDKTSFLILKKKFPELKYYEIEGDKYKIPAGYLIEQCGWKGKRVGNTGCYEKQALVIVNYGGATSEEIVAFVETIKMSVKNKYNITLQEEVNLILNAN